MTATQPVARQPLGAPDDVADPPATPLFDIDPTIISQYANSPVLLALLTSLRDALDPASLFDAFYSQMWNVDTAIGYGLDVWGRIVGVGRVLHIATGTYLGFNEATDAQTFGNGVFYNGTALTQNYALTDEVFRRLILAKALANISDGSIPSINRILTLTFPGYGNCYVQDNGDMTMAYVFGAALDPVDNAIISQSGVIPKPAGVSVTVVHP